MTSKALEKDIAVLRRDLKLISDQIGSANKELEKINRDRELARQDLKNIQTLKDPLIQSYEVRVKQKEKELNRLEADIAAAVRTREEIDEAMAARLSDGRQAIDNALRVEKEIEVSIKNFQRREESIRHSTQTAADEFTQQSSQLASLKEEVVSLEKERDRVSGLLLSQKELLTKQRLVEKMEKELNDGRDRLFEWEREVKAYEHDLMVMEKRLKPEYIATYRSINSKYINEEDIKANTRRISIQEQIQGAN